jgi:hexosaminidase
MKINILGIVILFFINFQSLAQTKINVMPYPQHLDLGKGDLIFNANISIGTDSKESKIINNGLQRFIQKYQNASLKTVSHLKSITYKLPNIFLKHASIDELGINNTEAYNIDIDSSIVIQSNSDIGTLHALETLNQLYTISNDGIHFPKLKIRDWPNYAWRGMMVDVARHFIPINIMKRNVDAMAAVKFNTLHIHVSDDEGFRIESKKYPQLHLKGSNNQYYTQEEMIDFVKYCKERGIEVYAEFDLPGHSQSFFAGYPEFAAEKKVYLPGPRFKLEGDKPLNLMSLMQMMNTTATPTLDVSAEATYQFLDNLTKEMKPLFSKAYMHMGLDENNGVAWLKNPKIASFMQLKGLKTTHELQNYFSERFSQIIVKNGLTPIAWEEAFHNGLNDKIAIQVWKPAFMGPTISLDSIAQNGNKSIVSRGFYLDVFMPAYYHYLNADFIKEKSNNNLLGGEAAIWTELVDESNFESRVWPRAAVIAERLWSSNKLQDVDDMYARLNSINHKLAWYGLQHTMSVNNHLDQIANGQLNHDATTFINLITPVKGYKKIMGLMTKPLSIQPTTLRQISDVIPVDAAGKWPFRLLVKQYLSNPNEENLQKIKQLLIEWKSLNKEVLKINTFSTIQKHADNLSIICNGVLEYLLKHDEQQRVQIMKQISLARIPQNETELVVLDELEALVTGKLKELDMGVPVF